MQVLQSGRPLRRPLIGIALSVAGGIFLASLKPVIIERALLLAIAFVILSVVSRKTRLASTLVFGAIVFTAASHALMSDSQLSKASVLRMQNELPKRGVEVIGQVNWKPHYYRFKSGTSGMWIFPVRVEGLRESGSWVKRCGEIDVRVVGAQMSEPSAMQGQRVWLKGELQKRNYEGGNPVGLKVAWPRYCKGLGKPRPSVSDWCGERRDAIAGRLDQGISGMPTQRAILRSLVLGYRNEIPSETYNCFKRTGSLHIFAISGLHVGIVGLLLTIVLKSLGVPRDWFGVWLVPLLFLYVAATGMKASALRAMVMAGVFLLAPLFRRKPDIPSSVAFAAILLLVLKPQELQSVGFIFSFVVVAFIVMVYAAIPRTVLKGGWIKTYGLSLAITSLAASLASMPITAYYFGRCSPVALVGNLVVVPLTFCIVLSGWLSILVPMASDIFNHAAVAFVDTMLACVQRLDSVPGSSFPVDAPPAMALVLWYGSLVYLLTHATRSRQRMMAVSGAGCSVLWMLLL